MQEVQGKIYFNFFNVNCILLVKFIFYFRLFSLLVFYFIRVKVIFVIQ